MREVTIVSRIRYCEKNDDGSLTELASELEKSLAGLFSITHKSIYKWETGEYFCVYGRGLLILLGLIVLSVCVGPTFALLPIERANAPKRDNFRRRP